MATESKYFQVRVLSPLNTSVWTPIIAPTSCSRVVIEAVDTTNNCKFRSDSDDSSTQKTIPAGMELNINAQACCFNAGDLVGYVQPVAGTGPVCVSYTR